MIAGGFGIECMVVLKSYAWFILSCAWLHILTYSSWRAASSLADMAISWRTPCCAAVMLCMVLPGAAFKPVGSCATAGESCSIPTGEKPTSLGLPAPLPAYDEKSDEVDSELDGEGAEPPSSTVPQSSKSTWSGVDTAATC